MRKNSLINIIKGKELIPKVLKYDAILFPMGINNSFNNGFSYEIGLNFPNVKESENETGYGNLNKIGTIHETEENGVVFIACYIHEGGYKKNSDGSYLNYEALEKCLTEVNEKYKDSNIATIVLGRNKEDGNGNADRIINIFKKTITQCKVTIYDYEDIGYRLKMFREIAAARKQLKDKEISREEYFKIRSDIEWRRKNGIFAVKPSDFMYIPKKNKNRLLFRGSKKQF